MYLLLFVLGVATFAARVKTSESKSRLREVHEQSRQLEVTLEHKGKEVAGKELRVDAALRALNESESALLQVKGRLERERSLACEKEKHAFVEKAKARLAEERRERDAKTEVEKAAASETLAAVAKQVLEETRKLEGNITLLLETKAILLRSITEAEGSLIIGRSLNSDDPAAVERFLRRTGVTLLPPAVRESDDRARKGAAAADSSTHYTGSFVLNLQICAAENERVLLPKWRGQGGGIGVATKELRSSLPSRDPFVHPSPVIYPSCAVVGNSGLLLQHYSFGEEIDSHAAVIRVNAGITEGLEGFVGSRTDIRFTSRLRDGSGSPKEVVMLQVTSEEDLGSFVEHKSSNPNSTVFMVSTDFHAHVQRELVGPATNGLFAVFFALQRCRRIAVYGFSGADDNGAAQPYYGDGERPARPQRRRVVGEGPLIMELARRAGKDRIRVAEPCNSPLDAVECESCAKGSHCEPGQAFPVPDDGFCMREGNYTSFYKCGGG